MDKEKRPLAISMIHFEFLVFFFLKTLDDPQSFDCTISDGTFIDQFRT